MVSKICEKSVRDNSQSKKFYGKLVVVQKKIKKLTKLEIKIRLSHPFLFSAQYFNKMRNISRPLYGRRKRGLFEDRPDLSITQ